MRRRFFISISCLLWALAVATMPQVANEKVLELYDEVLFKIQSHYVEPPKWQNLVDNGTASLMEALLDATFLETHLANVPQARVESFRRLLRDRVYGARTETRQAAM